MKLNGLQPVPNHRSLLSPDSEQEHEAVEALTEKYRNAATPLPDITVYVVDGQNVVIDGWYRVLAARKAGRLTINAAVCEATLKQAMLDSAGSNTSHGFPPTPAQKWAIVHQFLNDRNLFPTAPSVKGIARITHYSEKFVRRVRNSGETEYPEKAQPGAGEVNSGGLGNGSGHNNENDHDREINNCYYTDHRIGKDDKKFAAILGYSHPTFNSPLDVTSDVVANNFEWRNPKTEILSMGIMAEHIIVAPDTMGPLQPQVIGRDCLTMDWMVPGADGVMTYPPLIDANPPYSDQTNEDAAKARKQGFIGTFLERVDVQRARAAEAGVNMNIRLVLPYYPKRDWFTKLIRDGWTVCFINEPTFYHWTPKPNGGFTQAFTDTRRYNYVIAYIGDHEHDFIDCYGHWGMVARAGTMVVPTELVPPDSHGHGSTGGALLAIDENAPANDNDAELLAGSTALATVEPAREDLIITAEPQVIQGDCLDVLRKLPSDSVDLFLTSSPYGNQRKATYGGIDPEKYVSWFLPIAAEIFRVLKPSGSFVLNLKEHAENGVRHTYRLELVLELARRWNWIHEYIWHKKNWFPCVGGPRMPSAWEPIYHFSKGLKPKFDKEAVMPPRTEEMIKFLADTNAEHRGRLSGNGSGSRVFLGPKKTRVGPSANDVIFCATAQNDEHPAPFPEEIPVFFIKLLTEEDDAVVDMFCGSGTTGVACVQEGRRFLGIDLMPQYVELAKRRIAKAVDVAANEVRIIERGVRSELVDGAGIPSTNNQPLETVPCPSKPKRQWSHSRRDGSRSRRRSFVAFNRNLPVRSTGASSRASRRSRVATR